MTGSNLLVLHEDAQIIPMVDVPARVKDRLSSTDGSFVLSRPGTRSGSMVLDEQGGRLVQLLADGKLLTEALKQLASEINMPPQDVAREAYPLIEALVQKQYLKKKEVVAGTGEPRTFGYRFQVGDSFRGYTVLQRVQLLDDTEVYKVRLAQGGVAALKVVRKREKMVLDAFRREALILQKLDGGVAPKLIDWSAGDEETFIVMEWIHGYQSHDWAARVRNLPPKQRYSELLRLCTEIVRTYSELHACSVIHSDVYSKNLMIEESGALRIIDFGYSWCEEVNQLVDRTPRNVNPYFETPDMAKAKLLNDGRSLGTPSVLSDVYSVGALLYFLVTGSTYVDFSVEKTTLLKQILEGPMVSFVERKLQPWSGLEGVLRGMLAKEESQRIPSMAECLAALSSVELPEEQTRERAVAVSLDNAPTLRSLSSGEIRQELPPPSASINYGAAGIAYALLKSAHVLGDRSLVPEADYWTSLSRAWMDRGPDGAFAPSLGVSEDVTGPYAVLHRAEGVALIEALVAHSCLDTVSLGRACRRFMESAYDKEASIEFILGKTGVLNAIQQLSYLVNDPSPLISTGQALVANIVSEIAEYPSLQNSSVQFVGFGHGWAGIVYALLSWGREYDPELLNRCVPLLEALAAVRVQTRMGSFWPRRFDRPAQEGDVSSWCNGTAGLTLLWSEAFAATGDPRWLEIAREAARHTHSHFDTSITLCCGLAGRAYALATLASVSGEQEWLDAAHDCLQRAVPEPRYVDGFPHSLFKGYVGLELAQLEIGNPELLVFPTLASRVYGEPLPVDM